jgi:hypothetical protein
MSHTSHFVTPEFKITDRVHHPQKGPVVGNQSDWSGAVIPTPPPGFRLYAIAATWIIPIAYPPQSAKLPNGKWKDGIYSVSIFIGLDGWNTEYAVFAGTTSECVVSHGVITHQRAYAWTEWLPGAEVVVTNFSVRSGDDMFVDLGAAEFGNPSSPALVTFLNRGLRDSIGLTLTSPSAGISIQGSSAEWIVTNGSGSDPSTYANYGATFFYDTVVAAEAPTAGDSLFLTSANILNLVVGGTPVSTAVEDSPNGLLVWAFDNNGP